MTKEIYTVITFSPVQGFIEKSRKLRDLYGSSYLLSYLSWVICNSAEQHGCKVISPALPNITQGMPNRIIIEGDFPGEKAQTALLTAWKCVTETCREWIEDNVRNDNIKSKDDYKSWKRTWGLWSKYAWEFFWVQGESGQSITEVREKSNEKKRWRDWTGINWQGESSTLSGADAIAYPIPYSKFSQISDPRQYNYQQKKQDIRDFYKALSEKLGESFIKSVGLTVPDGEMRERSQEYGKSFINPDEELSIPELIKRLITHNVIGEKLTQLLKEVFADDNELILKKLVEQINQLSDDLNPTRFTDLSRQDKDKSIEEKTQQETQKEKTQKEKFWTGWFQGDGDRAGQYLMKFANKPEEAEGINKFSQEMREWGENFKKLPGNQILTHPLTNNLTPSSLTIGNQEIRNWRVIYAGGDDFLGVFYKRKDAIDCVDFFSKFKSQVWNHPPKKSITVSVGFVWAFPDIPQRDVLQHCREAEKSAKTNGRDRIAFRILFNNGNYLEWVCPWWLLESGLLSSYRDRNKSENKTTENWTHIYNDVAVLESRHAFDDDGHDNGLDIALGLLEIYFPKYVDVVKDVNNQLHKSGADLTKIKSGILGEEHNYYQEKSETIDQIEVNKALTKWIINLAKVGFHLCQQ